MMSRIQKAYEARFRSSLMTLRARRIEQGITWFTSTAQARSTREGVPLTKVFDDLCERARAQVKRWQHRSGIALNATTEPRLFLCDAGLGGLTRWLRAAGYDALWMPELDDAALVKKAGELSATFLTTDSLLMERRVVRDGLVPALWLPPTLTKEEQLAVVFREFDLPLRDSRCMSCGGELQRVEKESVRDRIPPKTWRWIDEYFLCARCGQLFWRGTHWQKIRRELEGLRAGSNGYGERS